MAEKLREQVGYGQRAVIPTKRASAPQTHAPASRHYAGHSAGIHPEDTPYTGDRPSRAVQPIEYDDETDDDAIYSQRPPTSARRYISLKEYEIAMSDGSFLQVTEQELSTLPEEYQRAAQLIESTPAVTALVRRRRQPNPKQPASSETVYEMPAARPRQEVYTEGNRKVVVHREPPPKKRRLHWMFFVGLAMFIMVSGWIAFGAALNWWQDKQNDWTYGNPRTFQTDYVVGINDSPEKPSHFIAMNLHGTVFVLDIEAGNPAKAQAIPVIGLSSDQDGDPVTISFQDVNGDGKPDMLVHVAGFSIVFLNNGKTFIGQHQ